MSTRPTDREPPPTPPRRLSEAQWVAIDWAAALLGLLGASAALRGSPGALFHFLADRDIVAHAPPPGLLEACAVLACLPIGLRRRWPLPTLGLVTTGAAVLALYGRSSPPVAVMLGLAGYIVVTRQARRAALRGLVTAEIVLAGALAVGQVANPGHALEILIPLVAAWFVGDGVAARRAYRAGVAEQEAQQRIIETERARQTLREERMAIARELHDVVAHSLTVITVQAGVGRRLMAGQPEHAGTTLHLIEETARTAQEELGAVLGLLRDGDGARGELTPAPGLADLEELANMMRAAGTPVELHVLGTDRRLSAALQLSIYRIVQEALTNVARHAPGAKATVELTVSAQQVGVVVSNDGGAAPTGQVAEQPVTSSAQHGIVGMRERVAAFGGSLEAEPLPRGGFRISAVIPLQVMP